MEVAGLKQISLDGFQVVNSNLFCSLYAPYMTIWCDSISFSQAVYTGMNNCEAITIMLNKEMKGILISAAASNSVNAINWKKGKNVSKYCKLSCATFCKQLFEEWNLDTTARYKAMGRMVQVDKRVMMLFDFGNAEKWKGEKTVK